MPLSRRQFFKHSGATALSGHAAASRAALGADASVQGPIARDPAARLPAVPFEGKHQAGIVDRPPPAACFAAFDLIAASRRELAELLQTLTRRARFLTAGGAPPNLGTGAPPSDSGTLGPVIPADGLTVTVGFGAGLFDDRYGLARAPAAAPHGDGLLPERQPRPHPDRRRSAAADLRGQLRHGDPRDARHRQAHARRDAAALARGRLHGAARPAGVPRNHLGFKDGIANPDVRRAAVAERLLWANAAAAASRPGPTAAPTT